ncbi:MAG TPA: hypothetical protein VFE53_02375 [Mucilaginibacter sp.]|jgi:hypothetical protein|nr:hypothetical protein [Mucilaginibacter sp.]
MGIELYLELSAGKFERFEPKPFIELCFIPQVNYIFHCEVNEKTYKVKSVNFTDYEKGKRVQEGNRIMVVIKETNENFYNWLYSPE